MVKVEIIQKPGDSETFIIFEPDGTKTVVRNGVVGIVIEQRRPDGSRGRFTTYEDKGLSLYPHLLRFLVSMHARLPKLPKPTHGNDDFASSAASKVEYVLNAQYPVTEPNVGWLYEKHNTIRAIQHPASRVRGLLISETGAGPVFLSPGTMRGVIAVLPRIFPRVQSYEIMMHTIREAAKLGKVRKPVFEKELAFPIRPTSRPPLRARKNCQEIVNRYARIMHRK